MKGARIPTYTYHYRSNFNCRSKGPKRGRGIFAELYRHSVYSGVRTMCSLRTYAPADSGIHRRRFRARAFLEEVWCSPRISENSLPQSRMRGRRSRHCGHGARTCLVLDNELRVIAASRSFYSAFMVKAQRHPRPAALCAGRWPVGHSEAARAARKSQRLLRRA